MKIIAIKALSVLLFPLFGAAAAYAIEPQRETLTVETFNLGLAHGYVDFAKERLPALAKELKQSSADILCLQEVWRPEDREALLKAVGSQYPHVHYTPVYQTPTSSRPSCLPWQLFGKGKFVSCMNNYCSDSGGDEFADCILENCSESLNRLKSENRDCASALMAKVGTPPVLAILQLLNPFYRSGLYAYQGSNGLMLLSKRELKDKKLEDFSDIATLNRRQALSSSIEFNGKDVRLLCSHLSANLSVPYTGAFQNWAEENFRQAERFAKLAQEESAVIAMGDFNCGLSNSNGRVQGELEPSCKLLLKTFADPAAELGECSFCSSNQLTSPEIDDVFIDHVYLKKLNAVGSRLTRKETVEIQTEGGAKSVNLSDHYGVEVTIGQD